MFKDLVLHSVTLLNMQFSLKYEQGWNYIPTRIVRVLTVIKGLQYCNVSDGSFHINIVIKCSLKVSQSIMKDNK